MRLLRPIRLLFITMLLALVITCVWLWNHISNMAAPIITPLNESYTNLSIIPEKHLGIRMTPLVFNGWDGGEVTALIARKDDEESARQRTVNADLLNNRADKLRHIDYALVCVDWDHGIRSALPLAEYLTAAGITCILWEPRGSNNRRAHCTHGLKESEDVPKLLDTITQMSGKERPVIIGVGQGYGAGLLLQAAALDDRLRGIVAIDAYASLRESISRTMPKNLLSHVKLALMDIKINGAVGFECFDVAPVESAANLNRNTPALIINLTRDNPICTLKDAITIYRQLPSDTKGIWTLHGPEDPPDATARLHTYTIGSKERATTATIELRLMKNEEEVFTSIIHWLNDDFLNAIDKPHVSTPDRPVLTTDQQL
ncbi:MAG: hypothetical protein Q4A24_06285 [Akkermansia sp.]|nr:hypothetical protein [Akkermansia sp.]